MRVRLRLDPACARGWHVALLHRLETRPDLQVEIEERPAPAAARLTGAVERLLSLERVLLRRPDSDAIRPLPGSLPRRPPGSTAPDRIIDLDGGSPTPGTWCLLYDGQPGESALMASLARGHRPLAELRDGACTIAAGRIGTDAHGNLHVSLAEALGRTITLITAALEGGPPAMPMPEELSPSNMTDSPPFLAWGRRYPAGTPDGSCRTAKRGIDPESISRPGHDQPSSAKEEGGHPPARPIAPMPFSRVDPAPLTVPEAAARLVGRLAGSARQRWRRLRRPDIDWRVGWRRLDGPDLFDRREHPSRGWTDLADDGRRFYADPCAIEHDGAVFLFVEEYPYATRKGIISAVRFGADGPEGRPEPVLERPFHLSYPFVFARDGAVWMVPESAASGTVDLYRATRFPDGWTHEATLVEGVAAGDATLVESGGRWWMFATVKDDGGSSSDALHLWSAPDFPGPWTPHPRNPVLIDCASARPAGRMVERDGALWRPVQDCRQAYGAALGLARVDALDHMRFTQTVAHILRPGPRWPGHLLHTVSSAGGYEFIDGSGR